MADCATQPHHFPSQLVPIDSHRLVDFELGIFLQARLLELSLCTVDTNRANRRVSQSGGCLPDSLENQHAGSKTSRSTTPRGTGQGCMAANPSSWLLAELLLSPWKLEAAGERSRRPQLCFSWLVDLPGW